MVKRVMKKAEMKVYKERLLMLRARLRGDVSAMEQNSLRKNRSEMGEMSTVPLHMADVGSDNFEQEFTLSLMQNDGATLSKIEAALERIEDGVYGSCEECGAAVPKTRLNAIPYTPYCVKCATELQS
ncbi:MAG: TraR/DksA family transcriptional regulator [Pirellulaceae bacterium]